MGEEYLSLHTLLKYIEGKEKEKFKIVKSEAFGIKGENSFKMILPETFYIKNVKFDNPYRVGTIVDRKGVSAFDMPHVFLFNFYLYSTEKEKSICVSRQQFSEGGVLFENFKHIPWMVDFEDVKAYAG